MRASGVLLAVLLAGVGHPSAAWAQSAEGLAETLFREGRAQLLAGDYVSACPKLTKSYQLEGGAGTLLLVAKCSEQSGRIATAMREYSEVVSLSEAQRKPTRAKFAKEAADAIRPRVPTITLNPTRTIVGLPGFGLELDGILVDLSRVDIPIPVDPGQHRIKAFATDREPDIQNLTIGERESRVLSIRPLVEKNHLTMPMPLSARASEPVRVAEGRSKGALIAWSSLTILSLGVGTGAGLNSVSKWSEARSICGGDPTQCVDTRFAQPSRDAAYTSSIVSTVAFAAGLLCLGGVIFEIVGFARAPRLARSTSTAQ